MKYNAFMKNVETTFSNLHNINYIQGQTIYVTDKQTLYLDCSDGSRIKLSDIIILNNDEEKDNIQNPISDKLYLVKDTLVLWIYHNKWININGRCLNADMVDGKHADEFALTIHSHTKEDIPEFANIKVNKDGKITVDYAEYAWDANKLNNVRFENFITSGLRFTSDIINDFNYDKSYITEVNDNSIIPEEIENNTCHILYIPSTMSENKSSIQLLFPFESDKMYIRYSNKTEWSEWNDISDADTFQGRTVDSFANAIHLHNKNDIIDLPDKLPADGGNADTLDGKHASDFISNIIINNGNFDNIITPGIYTVRNSNTNAPNNSVYTGLIVLNSDNIDYIEQIAIPEGSTELYVRSCTGYDDNENNYNWSPWTNIGYTSRILSTPNVAGYITDEYGNIKHTRINTEDYLSISKNSETNTVKLYYETGNIETIGTIKATEFVGNSSSATKLETSVKIGDADFNGTSNITLTQIGAFPAVKSVKNDFDSLKAPGYYIVTVNEDDNQPGTYEYYSLIVLNSTDMLGNYVQQIAFQEDTANVYIRSYSSSWSNWKQLAINGECNAKYVSNKSIDSIQIRNSGYEFYNQNKDWNDIKTPGYYGLMHNTAESAHPPVIGKFFYPLILKYSDTALTQIAIPYNCSTATSESIAYIRSYNGTWNEWRPLGANEFTISSNINWNSLNTSGIYHIKTTSGTNRPVVHHGTLFVDNNVGTPYQLYIPDGDTTSIYKRSLSSNEWVHMGFNNYNTISTTFSGTGWYRIIKGKKHNNSDNTGASGFITIQFDAYNKHSCVNLSITQNCGDVDFNLLSKTSYNAGYTKYRAVNSTDGYVYIDAYVEIDNNTNGTTIVSISGSGLTICNNIISCNSESGTIVKTITTI